MIKASSAMQSKASAATPSTNIASIAGSKAKKRRTASFAQRPGIRYDDDCFVCSQNIRSLSECMSYFKLYINQKGEENMSQSDFFNIYIETISDAFKKIRKIGFKKFNLVKDLLDSVQGFLSKEVYGRIEPSTYLLFFILILGSKTPKLYPVVLQAVQRLFSFNFINPNEELSSSLRLIKQQHKQFLILPIEDYSNKTFKEIYIETIINMTDKDQTLNLTIAKNLSLIWKLSQSTISNTLVNKIFDFMIESIAQNRIDQEEKILKSTLLEIIRHALESYKQSQDQRFLDDDNSISIKSVCKKYGNTLFDSIAIKQAVLQKYNIQNYNVIPDEGSAFQLRVVSEKNQINEQSGKFGWCINCRLPANYYCKINRVPVCSFHCKQQIINQFQTLDKFMVEEKRSATVFENHLRLLCKNFSKYFNHPDIKKRICFSQIFIFIASELKKINDRKLSLLVYKQLRNVLRQIIGNIYSQTDIFLSCIISLKKMMYLRVFNDEIEVFLGLIAKKLTHFLTPSSIKEEILKFCKDIVHSKIIFDLSLEYDCNSSKTDAVKELIDAVKTLYIGIPIPDGIAVPIIEESSVRRHSFQFFTLLKKSIEENEKIMPKEINDRYFEIKKTKNTLKFNIQKFNKSQKPLKVIKKFIEQEYLQKQPAQVSKFLHTNLKKLSLINIGTLIGDIDEFAGKVRAQYIGSIVFAKLPIDEGLRRLLTYFILPGQSQVVERIIQTFGIAYYEQNKDDTVFNNSDAVYSFSYLLMMLQTNLHNPQVVQKMTLKQFGGLSKNMNGPNIEFPQDFLQSVYRSVEKTQLGFHTKMKQIEIINAYKINVKTALEIHLRQLQRESKEVFQELKVQKIRTLADGSSGYPISIFAQEFTEQMIDVFTVRLRQSQEKEEIIKILDLIESVMTFNCNLGVYANVQKGIKNIWDEITKISTLKKYILIQSFLDWARKFSDHLYSQWKIVIQMLSKFYRNKLIKKEGNANKNVGIALIGDKCYIYESFIDNLFIKSSKYNTLNLQKLIFALIQISRQQIQEGCHPFCLQKINEILQSNSNRALQIFPLYWNELRDYYIELGKNKNERISLFGTDFLKQLITKFLKKKDLIPLQKEYMKPLQEIFLTSKVFGVKEYIIGGISYFVTNHFQIIKTGWKTILSIICNSFEEDQDVRIKEKAFGIVKRIYQNNFNMINLDENYVDFVQILGRLARQKEQMFPKGCLQAVNAIVKYHHKKYNINLENPNAEQNAALDINFWQTIFLPLLSTIYGICGDSRTDVQQASIECLFSILMKYGKLFKYQFWKMVLQGILRPTFQEITFTSQSKPLKKAELDIWLKTSFTKLFTSINELIYLYYDDFRLFLYDVFKIYENCILNHSLKILIQLSLNALNDLLNLVAGNFQTCDWEVYLQFSESVLKKTIPTQISSLQNWNKSKDLVQNNYEGKCFALYLFLLKSQQIYDKYPKNMSQSIYLQMLTHLHKAEQFVIEFNQNIELREALWKDGFYQDIKSLPGLLKHQLQILKFQAKIYFKLTEFKEGNYSNYFNHIFYLFERYQKLLIWSQPKVHSLKVTEQERQGVNYQVLFLQTIIKQLYEINFQRIKQLGYKEKLFMAIIQVVNNKSYCSKCIFCQNCQTNSERQKLLSEEFKQIMIELFKI